MKKSKTVRILCMALALLLVSQFAVTALANEELDYAWRETSDSDVDGNGYDRYFRVEKYAGVSQRFGVRAITQRKYHTQGTATYFYAGSYEIYSASALMNSEYSDIRTLAQSIGVKPSYSLSMTISAITVPANSSTGYYTLKTDFWDYSGEWDVYVDNGISNDCMEYTVYPFAAQQCSGELGYLYCS